MNMHRVLLYCCSVILWLCSLACHAEIYQWIDESGRVHFGDKKIHGVNQRVVTPKTVKSAWQGFEIEVNTDDVVLTAKERQIIVDGVNDVYEFYDKILYFDMYKTVPVKILVLKDRSAYKRYLNERNATQLSASYGVYFGSDNQIVVYLRERRSDTFKTIRHEVSHAIADTVLPYIPAWLNEGLAEQMETLSRNDKGLYLRPHIENRLAVASALTRNKLIAIDEFLKLPSDKWRHSLRQSDSQLQSHAGQFVFFLLSTMPNRNFVVRLMHKFARGSRTLSYYLVDENYLGGVKALDVTWYNWVRQQSQQNINFY